MSGSIKTFTIIGREQGCPWCDRAKELLDRHGLPYLSSNYNEALAFMFDAMELKTVPQIWHGTLYIGGFAELERYISKVRL